MVDAVGRFVGYEELHREYEVLRDPMSTPPDTRGAKLGEILTASGRGRPPVSGIFDSGREAYIWRPADGSPDVIYRDRAAVAATLIVEAEWVHNPNWNGPDAARMSAIWGDVSVCTR